MRCGLFCRTGVARCSHHPVTLKVTPLLRQEGSGSVLLGGALSTGYTRGYYLPPASRAEARDFELRPGPFAKANGNEDKIPLLKRTAITTKSFAKANGNDDKNLR